MATCSQRRGKCSQIIDQESLLPHTQWPGAASKPTVVATSDQVYMSLYKVQKYPVLAPDPRAHLQQSLCLSSKGFVIKEMIDK